LHSKTIPGRGTTGSAAAIEWEWASYRASKFASALRYRITRGGEDQISVLREVSRRAGFDVSEGLDFYQWLSPVVFKRIPMLVFNAIEIEYPHDPHPTSHYVGPMVRKPLELEDLPKDTAERVKDLIETKAQSGKRLIYCSFGAWHREDDSGLIRRVLAAAGNVPSWEVAVGLGSRMSPDLLGPISPNVHVFPNAPQVELLAHADVAVHHAGINSINECLTLGVPMVVYPFDYRDTPGAAARIGFHGLGEVGDRSTDQPEQITRRIQRVLDDSDIASRVDHMSTVFESYQRREVAVKEIERML
jgi:UDP:flavonoid glycosyltransferase YjiC (YdhE family)